MTLEFISQEWHLVDVTCLSRMLVPLCSIFTQCTSEKDDLLHLAFRKKQMYGVQSPTPTTLTHVTLCVLPVLLTSGGLFVCRDMHSCLQDRFQMLCVTPVGQAGVPQNKELWLLL